MLVLVIDVGAQRIAPLLFKTLWSVFSQDKVAKLLQIRLLVFGQNAGLYLSWRIRLHFSLGRRKLDQFFTIISADLFGSSQAYGFFTIAAFFAGDSKLALFRCVIDQKNWSFAAFSSEQGLHLHSLQLIAFGIADHPSKLAKISHEL